MDKRRHPPSTGPVAPPPAADQPRDVGEGLRALFRAVEGAPVPDAITRLVEKLEKSQRRSPRTN